MGRTTKESILAIAVQLELEVVASSTTKAFNGRTSHRRTTKECILQLIVVVLVEVVASSTTKVFCSSSRHRRSHSSKDCGKLARRRGQP
jgi:hypothetical protein